MDWDLIIYHLNETTALHQSLSSTVTLLNTHLRFIGMCLFLLSLYEVYLTVVQNRQREKGNAVLLMENVPNYKEALLNQI